MRHALIGMIVYALTHVNGDTNKIKMSLKQEVAPFVDVDFTDVLNVLQEKDREKNKDKIKEIEESIEAFKLFKEFLDEAE
jgi:hypothetical protein